MSEINWRYLQTGNLAAAAVGRERDRVALVEDVKKWEIILNFSLSRDVPAFDLDAYNQAAVAFSQCLEMLDRPSISPDFESLYAKAKTECIKLLDSCI